MRWCKKIDVTQERWLIIFQGHASNFKVTRLRKSSILSQIGPLWTVTPVWIHSCYEMMHNAWSCLEEVSYYFSMSSVKYQGHTGQKSRQFWPESSVYCFSRSSVKFQDHAVIKPNWAFPDSCSSLYSPIALKRCTELDVVSKRCPIVYQGHP